MALISDISSWAPASNLSSKVDVKESSSSSLNFDDYLKLMVSMFQNQDPENAASTTEMMNMLVQMTTVQAITDVTDATTMLYTSSLVGKEVTIGKYTKEGLQEIPGVVTGTGTYGGKPVVFVDGVSYYLSDIMAVGKLPPKAETVTPTTPPVEPPPETNDTENNDDENDEIPPVDNPNDEP